MNKWLALMLFVLLIPFWITVYILSYIFGTLNDILLWIFNSTYHPINEKAGEVIDQK